MALSLTGDAEAYSFPVSLSEANGLFQLQSFQCWLMTPGPGQARGYRAQCLLLAQFLAEEDLDRGTATNPSF